jgi:hypothetical protein
VERLLPESDLHRQFDVLEAGLRRCADGFEELHFTFGGLPVRLRVAGRRLASLLTRPFAHLRSDPSPAGDVRLDIALWDERETGVHPQPHRPEVTGPDGVTEIAETGRFLQQRKPAHTICLDRRRNRLVGVFALDDDHVDVYERGKPFARLLAEWYADHGVAVMHAGLVARGADGVILAGKGGSGKSTTALACARAGFDFLGEDYAALQFTGAGGVVGHSAYNSVFVAPGTAARFPELDGHLVASRRAAEPKSVVLLADMWPSRLVARVPVRAVALCRVTDAERWRVRPASRAEALLAIGPSSLLQIHGRRRDSLDRLARLVSLVPCFHLDLGRDVASAPSGVDAVLAQVRPS